MPARRRAGRSRRTRSSSACETTGDCWARAQLRIAEIDASLTWLDAVMAGRAGVAHAPARRCPASHRHSSWSSLVEGWRGEVVHCLETDPARSAGPLQGAGSVAAELDGPRDGRARQRHLGLPDLQQELRPLVLRERPVSLFKSFLRPGLAGQAVHPGCSHGRARPGFAADRRSRAPPAHPVVMRAWRSVRRPRSASIRCRSISAAACSATSA